MNTPFFPAFRARLSALGARVQCLRQHSLLQLDQLFGPWLPPGLLSQADEGLNSRDRIYNVRRTFFGFLYQVLNPACPCRQNLSIVSSILKTPQYAYNAGNQRTQQVFSATNYVNYSYDNIGQLKTAFVVTLTGGPQAKNIFWQVTQATLGTTAEVKGIILSATAITMNTGATLDGRALAQTAVTLQMNAVTEPY